MTKNAKGGSSMRSDTASPRNRKARGSGHERLGEILAASRALFLEHGVAGVTTRQIALRVGISHAALYFHFKNKEEILERLVAAAFDKLGVTIRAIDAHHGNALGFLRALIPAYIRFGIENPEEYRLAFVLSRTKTKTKAERDADVGLAVFEVLVKRMSAGVAEGTLALGGISALEAAQVLWASLHGLVALVPAYPDFGWAPMDALIAAQTDMLLTGLVADTNKGVPWASP